MSWDDNLRPWYSEVVNTATEETFSTATTYYDREGYVRYSDYCREGCESIRYDRDEENKSPTAIYANGTLAWSGIWGYRYQ